MKNLFTQANSEYIDLLIKYDHAIVSEGVILESEKDRHEAYMKELEEQIRTARNRIENILSLTLP